MTKANLNGLTIAQIKAEYPDAAYKASMKKADVINAALASVKAPAKNATSVYNNERQYGG